MSRRGSVLDENADRGHGPGGGVCLVDGGNSSGCGVEELVRQTLILIGAAVSTIGCRSAPGADNGEFEGSGLPSGYCPHTGNLISPDLVRFRVRITRYQRALLFGEPVEVITHIDVPFILSQ